MNIKTVTYFVLYEVVFGTGEDGSINKSAGFFNVETEADKVAKLKRGSYNTEGDVDIREFANDVELPPIYETAEQWYRQNLTVVEYEKLKESGL